MKPKYFGMMAMASVLALGLSGGVMANLPGTASEPVSEGGVTPYIIGGTNPGGNRTCAEVGEAHFDNAAYYKCYSDRVKYEDFADGVFGDISGNQDCDRNDIDVTTDGTYVDFMATPDGIGAAIVKGSNDANTYVYTPQALSDSGLASPLNASGNPAGLSNLTFCWNPEGDIPPCYTDETAWAAGSRYTARGNWATYTVYAGVEKTVTLYAGQTINVGTVAFSAPVDGKVTITVTLTGGWVFAMNPDPTGEEGPDNNIKVQDYANAPSGNPAPGLFRWKTFAEGQEGSVEVPANNYYGVHVDVATEVVCPE